MNGQEMDNEVDAGNGNTMTAEYWEYDARIGRRMNPDPIDVAWQSPYATFDNSPIALSDPNGAEATGDKKPKPKHKWTGGKQGGAKDKKHRLSKAVDKIGEVLSKQPKVSLAGPPTQAFVQFIPAAAAVVTAVIEALEAGTFITAGAVVIHEFADALSGDKTAEPEGDWIVYEIFYDEVDENQNILATHKTYKYGISGQQPYVTKEGYPRPETQVSQFNKEEAAAFYNNKFQVYRQYRYSVYVVGVSKIHAELIEQEFVNLYYSVFKTTPEGNKRPIPDRMRGRTRKKFDDISPDKLKKVKDYIKQFMK